MKRCLIQFRYLVHMKRSGTTTMCGYKWGRHPNRGYDLLIGTYENTTCSRCIHYFEELAKVVDVNAFIQEAMYQEF